MPMMTLSAHDMYIRDKEEEGDKLEAEEQKLFDFFEDAIAIPVKIPIGRKKGVDEEDEEEDDDDDNGEETEEDEEEESEEEQSELEEDYEDDSRMDDSSLEHTPVRSRTEWRF